jgi:hypothetical protein
MRVDQFEQFVVHGFGLLLLSASQCFGGTVMQVVLHQVARHAAQRFLYRGDLRDDVRAVAVLFHHFLQAAHLAFDSPEAVLIGFLQNWIHTDGFASAGRAIASAIGQRAVVELSRNPACLRGSLRCHDTLHPYLYPIPLFAVKRSRVHAPQLVPGCYTACMTLVDITYELQSPLTEEQLRHLGQFANTYGLRSFRVDESKKQLSFEYDASRLRETQVSHVLGQAKIAVARRVN